MTEISFSQKAWPQVNLDLGDLFTINEFNEMCIDGAVTDNDGHGYFATNERFCRELPVLCCHFSDKQTPHWATHVVWFNK